MSSNDTVNLDVSENLPSLGANTQTPQSPIPYRASPLQNDELERTLKENKTLQDNFNNVTDAVVLDFEKLDLRVQIDIMALYFAEPASFSLYEKRNTNDKSDILFWPEKSAFIINLNLQVTHESETVYSSDPTQLIHYIEKFGSKWRSVERAFQKGKAKMQNELQTVSSEGGASSDEAAPHSPNIGSSTRLLNNENPDQPAPGYAAALQASNLVPLSAEPVTERLIFVLPLNQETINNNTLKQTIFNECCDAILERIPPNLRFATTIQKCFHRTRGKQLRAISVFAPSSAEEHIENLRHTGIQVRGRTLKAVGSQFDLAGRIFPMRVNIKFTNICRSATVEEMRPLLGLPEGAQLFGEMRHGEHRTARFAMHDGTALAHVIINDNSSLLELIDWSIESYYKPIPFRGLQVSCHIPSILTCDFCAQHNKPNRGHHAHWCRARHAQIVQSGGRIETPAAEGIVVQPEVTQIEQVSAQLSVTDGVNTPTGQGALSRVPPPQKQDKPTASFRLADKTFPLSRAALNRGAVSDDNVFRCDYLDASSMSSGGETGGEFQPLNKKHKRKRKRRDTKRTPPLIGGAA